MRSFPLGLSLPPFLCLPLFLACSSDPADHGSGAPHDDAGASTEAGSTAPAADAGTSDATVGTPPAAPTISTVAKMAGGLHVTWKNGQKDCDTVEGERKSDTEEYKVVFTVPGVADNKHDALGLSAGKIYTYRVRCKKGDTASAYSNEKAGTP